MENLEKVEKPNTKKPDKLTDKAFSRLLITSIFAILVCIVCLCSTTWAWFVDDAPSASNTIATAAECLLEVSVLKDGEATPLSDIENGVELQVGVDYLVTLSLPANTASGYCIIEAGGEQYYTDYIARHEEAEAKTITFKLTVAETQTVIFTNRWGIYARESSVVDNLLAIP